MAQTIDRSPSPSAEPPGPGGDRERRGRSLADTTADAAASLTGLARWLGRHPVVVLAVIVALAVLDSLG